LRCLIVAGVLVLENGCYQRIAQELPEAFLQAQALFYELRDAIAAGVFDQADADGVLPFSASQGLVTLGIAERQGECMILTAPGRRYFIPDQGLYLGNYVLGAVKSLEMQLSHLQETVKTGQRLLINDPKFFASTIDIMFLMNYSSALHLAEFLTAKDGITNALDLGAGSGVWSVPLARTNPTMCVTAFDSAFVLEKTRIYTRRYGVSEQYRYQEVDFTTQDNWGAAPYDVIYLCHFCEVYSVEGNQGVIARCVRHLRPGGYLVYHR